MSRNDPTVFALLIRAHAIAQKAATAMLFESGVSPMEAWLLEVIPEDGRACASELAEKLEVPTSTVTRTLRRLESYGYLTLTKGHFFDIRVLRPKLTALGVAIRDGAYGFERDLDATLLEGVTQNALAGLLAGLTHIERTGKNYMSPPPRRAKGDAALGGES
jgi:DNA-binding MarR family transcriptional regulator